MTTPVVPVINGNRPPVHDFECDTCRGTGKSDCRRCKGQGALLVDPYTNGWEQCPAECDRGKWDCEDCDGAGHYERPESPWDRGNG